MFLINYELNRDELNKLNAKEITQADYTDFDFAFFP